MTTEAVILVIALTIAAGQAFAQPTGPATDNPNLEFHNALIDLPSRDGAVLAVTTPAWPFGGDIPFENTHYRGDHFPGLAWTAGPAATKSYAIIMQDTGIVGTVRHRPPALHWTLYNVPAGVTSLTADMPPTGVPPGSSLGPNNLGKSQPYMGPGPPPGPRHVYHLQVFALDAMIPVDPALTIAALTEAMKDHVLASGEVIGLGAADPLAPPRPPRPAATP
jgi:Raf kinase inhibitor-like YbhB/YbcL family protein